MQDSTSLLEEFNDKDKSVSYFSPDIFSENVININFFYDFKTESRQETLEEHT